MQRRLDGRDGVDRHFQPSLDDRPYRSRAYLQARAGLNVTLGVGNVGGGYRPRRTLRCNCLVGPTECRAARTCSLALLLCAMKSWTALNHCYLRALSWQWPLDQLTNLTHPI